ncbi:hypothetical protein MASR1M48_16470 [Lactococcus petauri]
MDIFLESKQDNTIGLWSRLQNKAKELGYNSPSALVRHLLKDGLDRLDNGQKSGNLLLPQSFLDKVHKDLVVNATPRTINIHLKNIPDKAKLRVSFFEKNELGNSSYVSKCVVLQRENGKIVQRRN